VRVDGSIPGRCFNSLQRLHSSLKALVYSQDWEEEACLLTILPTIYSHAIRGTQLTPRFNMSQARVLIDCW